jgi:hypothetical protein
MTIPHRVSRLRHPSKRSLRTQQRTDKRTCFASNRHRSSNHQQPTMKLHLVLKIVPLFATLAIAVPAPLPIKIFLPNSPSFVPGDRVLIQWTGPMPKEGALLTLVNVKTLEVEKLLGKSSLSFPSPILDPIGFRVVQNISTVEIFSSSAISVEDSESFQNSQRSCTNQNFKETTESPAPPTSGMSKNTTYLESTGRSSGSDCMLRLGAFWG